MALVVADRVQETTATTGTGTYTLAGAKDGFQSFAAIGDGNTTYYACTDGTDYEVGIGTFTLSGTTLARTTIIESSNDSPSANAAVDWGAGDKDIFVTLPASKAILEDASNNVAIGNNITVGGTVDGVDIATNIPSSLGTAGQVLTVNSGETAGEWASLPSVSLAEQEFTATSGQTVFTVTGGITNANNVSVYLNGAKLFSTDVTISAAANTVTLATGAATGDLVTVTEVAGAASGSSGISNIVEDTTPQLGGNLDLNGSDITGSGDIKPTTYQETVGTESSGTLDLSTGNVFSHAPSTNVTYVFSNPPSSGTAFGFTLKVSPSATITQTWPASVDWAGGSAPTATASGETDVFTFFTHDGGTTYYGFHSGDAMA